MAEVVAARLDPPQPEDAAIAAARSWLGTTVRVHIIDGRVFVGRLWCLDAHANIILANAEEYAPPDVVEKESALDRMRRFMGMVLVTRATLIKFDVGAAA